MQQTQAEILALHAVLHNASLKKLRRIIVPDHKVVITFVTTVNAREIVDQMEDGSSLDGVMEDIVQENHLYIQSVELVDQEAKTLDDLVP